MELPDVCHQASGHVICESQIGIGHMRRVLSTLNRRQHIFRAAFSAAPESVPRRASPKLIQQCSESRVLLKAELQRRQALAMLSVAIPALTLPIPALAEGIADSVAGSVAESDFTEFKSQKQGYTVKIPSAWEQKEKAGADVLFVGKGADVGVTVSPIRINSLKEFGNLETVGEKLLGTEKAKESTESAAMLSSSSREGAQGTVIYTYDYKIDTTRGKKRIVSTVAIKGRKLYICNGTVKCSKPGLECDPVGGPGMIEAVEAVSQSFDVL